MNILKIPFHSLLNIKPSQSEKYIFILEPQTSTQNHLGTVHACAQLTLAEATSGQFLLQQFATLEDNVVPVVRNSQAKYHKPANGFLYSQAEFTEGNREDYLNQFEKRKRILAPVLVKLFDEYEQLILTAKFNWLITELVRREN